MSSSNLGSQHSLSPKEKGAKPPSTEPLSRHGWPRPPWGSLLLASKALLPSLFSFSLWRYSISLPFTDCIYLFPLKKWMLSEANSMAQSSPLSLVFPLENTGGESPLLPLRLESHTLYCPGSFHPGSALSSRPSMVPVSVVILKQYFASALF